VLVATGGSHHTTHTQLPSPVFVLSQVLQAEHQNFLWQYAWLPEAAGAVSFIETYGRPQLPCQSCKKALTETLARKAQRVPPACPTVKTACESDVQQVLQSVGSWCGFRPFSLPSYHLTNLRLVVATGMAKLRGGQARNLKGGSGASFACLFI